MSSDSSMSSGSRIRQFGLYRTIDARTEEFLRLSRKRQIRQGCACAAVSTAITVTVVIVVFIVYEFSLNSEINLDNSLKSNWFNLMNVTSDGHFESSFTKNVDPTTLQLLPMLIKALKKNVILEKVIEEHSSSSPLTDRKHTTDDYYSNQIFTKNWLKMPTSKLYAIEYKTSPVVYFRNPTKNIELFTKIRKVRDYQRIVNYIDKMISEKVYVGSTKPMVKGEMYTYSHRPPLKSKMKHAKGLKAKKVYHKTDIPANYNLRKADKKDSSCKCPKNISILLQKFLDGIQKVLPLSTTKMSPENYSEQLILQKPMALEPENMNRFITTASDVIQKTTPMEPEKKLITTKILPKTTEPIQHNCNEETTQSSFNHTTTEDDYLTNSLHLNLSNALNNKKGHNIRSTTINNVVEGTDVEGILFPTTTKPIKIATENANDLPNKYYTSSSEEHNKKIDRLKKTDGPIFNDTEYDDEFYSTTPKDSESDFVDKLRLIKSKTVLNKIFRHKRVQKKNHKSRELITNNDVDQESSRFLNKLNSDLYQLIEQNARQLRLEMTTSDTPSFATKSTKTKAIDSVTTESARNTLNTTFPTANFEIENTDEFDVKLLSSQMVPLDDSNLTSVIAKTETVWENLNDEHDSSVKSMIPVDRPVYLEFRRNDWKHEEPTDFDYNINANIYDMPN